MKFIFYIENITNILLNIELLSVHSSFVVLIEFNNSTIARCLLRLMKKTKEKVFFYLSCYENEFR